MMPNEVRVGMRVVDVTTKTHGTVVFVHMAGVHIRVNWDGQPSASAGTSGKACNAMAVAVQREWPAPVHDRVELERWLDA